MRLSPPNSPIELSEISSMNRVKNSTQGEQAYEPLLGREDSTERDEVEEGQDHGDIKAGEERPYSRVAYSIFLLLGIAMLWPWNMFLAAAPYFQRRFQGNDWILNHFQPAETSMSTVTSLIWVGMLSLLQKNASYPKRIITSLVIMVILFTILAISTLVQTDARTYFGFLLVAIFVSASSTGLVQNGAMSFSVGFGRMEYTQAIMTGQAVAGVLPPMVQIISVAAVSSKDEKNGAPAESSKSAFAYFITATVISGGTLLAFFELMRRKARYDALQPVHRDHTTIDGATQESVPLTRLFWKVPYLALALVVCFMVTMAFPVFTTSILSVNGMNPAIFIPLSFLLWNIGDLLGRLSTMIPQVLLIHHPFALFCLAMARLLFIPLYFLCNIKGRGAVINSDFFYLAIVQLLFGMTNGYLGSNCFMAAGEWVAPEERAVVGGFMALFLVIGLAIGSLLSFLLGDI